MIEGHLIFNGSSRLLKMYIKGAEDLGKPDGLLHTVFCHDVGVNDATITAGEDAYGSKCKCPPGTNYLVGTPMPCATRNEDGTVTRHNDDDQAYGCWFIPLGDSDQHSFELHGRAGIGIHGGGSDLPDPFALPNQGWEYTFGCLRLQNADLENTLVPFVNFIHEHVGVVKLDVVWP
jgi:hypothetical protein